MIRCDTDGVPHLIQRYELAEWKGYSHLVFRLTLFDGRVVPVSVFAMGYPPMALIRDSEQLFASLTTYAAKHFFPA